jgi:hypothetical protein
MIREAPRVGVRSGPGYFFMAGLLLCAGCTIERGSEDSTEETLPGPVEPVDSLRVVLQVPPQVGSGTDVPIQLRIENVGARTLDLSLQGRDIVFDVLVSDSRGEIVWRRLEGETTQSILQVVPLAVGEVLTLRATWPQRAGPGEYSVSAVIPTDAFPLRPQPVRLRIVE